MLLVKPINTVQVLTKNTQKKIVKVPPYLAVFFFLNLLIGFELGYTKYHRKEVKCFLRFVQSCVIFSMATIMLVPGQNNARMCGIVISGIEYITLVLCLQVAKYNIYEFIQNIHNIDQNVIQSMGNRIGIVVTVAFTIIFAIKSVMCYAFCEYYIGQNLTCPGYMAPGIITCTCTLVLDGISILEMLINYYIYRSVNYLKNLVECRSDLKDIINVYVSIGVCYDKIMPLYGKLILGELAASIPRSMIMLWFMIKSIKNNEEWLATAGQALFIAHISFQLCGPALSAEMINTEVKTIKLLLNNRLIIETDKEKKQDLLRMLQYMEARKLEYKLCRVIPVDMRFVVAIFNVTTTYFIVIIQFTHLL